MWTNLAIALENLGRSVDFEVYWEAPHCADYEPWKLMKWVQNITGYKIQFLKQIPIKTTTTQIFTHTIATTYRETYTTHLTHYITTTAFLEVERTVSAIQTVYKVEPTTMVVEKTVVRDTKPLVIAVVLPLVVLTTMVVVMFVKKKR